MLSQSHHWKTCSKFAEFLYNSLVSITKIAVAITLCEQASKSCSHDTIVICSFIATNGLYGI